MDESAFVRAERENRQREEAEAAARRRIATNAEGLLLMIDRAVIVRLKCGEHCSNGEIAAFLAANGVGFPRSYNNEDPKTPEHWPRVGLAPLDEPR